MVETPVTYKSTFKISELEKVKLEQPFEDGTKVKMEVPLFTGQQGLEGLVYIVDRFKDACKALDWVEGTELFQGFAKILQGQAYSYWIDEILTKFPEEEQSIETFEEAIGMMKISFGGGTLARNHILQYIQTNDCKKPRKPTVEEHVRRISALVSLANQSAGTDAVVTKTKLNELLLVTMPSQWQQNFKLSGHTIADMTTDKFITYFSEVKGVYDTEQQANKNNQGRGGRFGRMYGRGGRFDRGGGRFSSFVRGGRGRFSTWGRGNGFYGRRSFNNSYRGGAFNYNNQNGGNRNNRNNGGRNFYRANGRGMNTTGGRFNTNTNNQGSNNHHVYWNDNNDWNTSNNQGNNGNNGNDMNAEVRENRIVEVNHWETLNNNREAWDRTRYAYHPSQGR